MLPSALPSTAAINIFYKLREAVVNAFDKNDLAYLYTKETALDFHYLVYCVFLLAGQAIRKIKDHQVPLKQAGAKKNKASYASLVEVLKSHISAAVLPMKFLHCVLNSTVFKRHIGVWTNDGECLDDLLPKWSQKEVNMEFGKKRQILAESKKGRRRRALLKMVKKMAMTMTMTHLRCANPFVDASLMSMMPHCRCQVFQGSKCSLDGLGRLWPSFLVSEIWKSTLLNSPLSTSTSDPKLEFSL